MLYHFRVIFVLCTFIIIVSSRLSCIIKTYISITGLFCILSDFIQFMYYMYVHRHMKFLFLFLIKYVYFSYL